MWLSLTFWPLKASFVIISRNWLDLSTIIFTVTSFPTVCGMPMENFSAKKPVIEKLWCINISWVKANWLMLVNKVQYRSMLTLESLSSKLKSICRTMRGALHSIVLLILGTSRWWEFFSISGQMSTWRAGTEWCPCGRLKKSIYQPKSLKTWKGWQNRINKRQRTWTYSCSW